MSFINKWVSTLIKSSHTDSKNLLRIAILISGEGTNLLALAEAINDPSFPVEIRLVVAEDAELSENTFHELKKYTKNSMMIKCLPCGKGPEAQIWYWGQLQEYLIRADVELICLAGFMNLIPEHFIKAWSRYGSDRSLASIRGWDHVTSIVNIHPSLLPSFPGLEAPRQAIESGTKFTGCTIHFVDEGIDSGAIIAQGIVPIKKRDTVESLIGRIQQAEHYYYKQIIKLIAEDKLSFTEEGKVILEDSLIHTFNINYPHKITELSVNTE